MVKTRGPAPWEKPPMGGCPMHSSPGDPHIGRLPGGRTAQAGLHHACLPLQGGVVRTGTPAAAVADRLIHCGQPATAADGQTSP